MHLCIQFMETRCANTGIYVLGYNNNHNYANNANKQEFWTKWWVSGGALLYQLCRPGTHMQHIFSIKINNPICASSEHLFQPQTWSCGHHSKSTAIPSAIWRCHLIGLLCVLWPRHTRVWLKHSLYTSQNHTFTANPAKLGFTTYPLYCIILYAPDDPPADQNWYCEAVLTVLVLFSCNYSICVTRNLFSNIRSIIGQ